MAEFSRIQQKAEVPFSESVGAGPDMTGLTGHVGLPVGHA